MAANITGDESGIEITISAFMMKFRQLFDIDIIWITDEESVIEAIRKHRKDARGIDNNDTDLYPFATIKITSAGVSDDAPNPRVTARSGSGLSISGDMDNTYILKHFKFWSNINCELEIKTNSLQSACKLVERLSIACCTKAFYTGVNIEADDHGGTDAWNVIVQGARSVAFPTSSNEATDGPRVYKINHSLEMRSQFGEYKAVPKINNEGLVTTNIVAGNSPALEVN